MFHHRINMISQKNSVLNFHPVRDVYEVGPWHGQKTKTNHINLCISKTEWTHMFILCAQTLQKQIRLVWSDFDDGGLGCIKKITFNVLYKKWSSTNVYFACTNELIMWRANFMHVSKRIECLSQHNCMTICVGVGGYIILTDSSLLECTQSAGLYSDKKYKLFTIFNILKT